jgi:hypothetical protein
VGALFFLQSPRGDGSISAIVGALKTRRRFIRDIDQATGIDRCLYRRRSADSRLSLHRVFIFSRWVIAADAQCSLDAWRNGLESAHPISAYRDPGGIPAFHP